MPDAVVFHCCQIELPVNADWTAYLVKVQFQDCVQLREEGTLDYFPVYISDVGYNPKTGCIQLVYVENQDWVAACRRCTDVRFFLIDGYAIDETTLWG